MIEENLALSGDLTVREVPGIWRQHRSRFRSGTIPQSVDLDAVDRTDSSALALLLEWRSLAQEHNASIRFTNPPNSLRVIARLTEVEELLGWEKLAREA